MVEVDSIFWFLSGSAVTVLALFVFLRTRLKQKSKLSLPVTIQGNDYYLVKAKEYFFMKRCRADVKSKNKSTDGVIDINE